MNPCNALISLSFAISRKIPANITSSRMNPEKLLAVGSCHIYNNFRLNLVYRSGQELQVRTVYDRTTAINCRQFSLHPIFTFTYH